MIPNGLKTTSLILIYDIYDGEHGGFPPGSSADESVGDCLLETKDNRGQNWGFGH